LDRPTDTKRWEPDEPETLEGVFHLEGGLNWAVRTRDGTVWLLESDAERQLESLGPDEGRDVEVFYAPDTRGRFTYHVTLR
jgi:hypothetical protein